MIKVSKGRIPKAKKVVLYGPEGIGKSTFAAQFPDPVFLDTEGSTASMDVTRIEPLSWMEMLSDIKEIIKSKLESFKRNNDYKSVNVSVDVDPI